MHFKVIKYYFKFITMSCKLHQKNLTQLFNYMTIVNNTTSLNERPSNKKIISHFRLH